MFLNLYYSTCSAEYNIQHSRFLSLWSPSNPEPADPEATPVAEPPEPEAATAESTTPGLTPVPVGASGFKGGSCWGQLCGPQAQITSFRTMSGRLSDFLWVA